MSKNKNKKERTPLRRGLLTMNLFQSTGWTLSLSTCLCCVVVDIVVVVVVVMVVIVVVPIGHQISKEKKKERKKLLPSVVRVALSCRRCGGCYCSCGVCGNRR